MSRPEKRPRAVGAQRRVPAPGGRRSRKPSTRARPQSVRSVVPQIEHLSQHEHRPRRREAYVGAWLPEPLLTAPDVAEDVELADILRFMVRRRLTTAGS